MTFDQLEHAIRAACAAIDDSEVIIFGSQAILGEFPDAHPDLRQSMEADIAPKNFPERVELIEGSLGELSQFHQTHGFYVHGVPIEAATLPKTWASRMVKVQTPGTNGKTGWCIEGHDLAASKLVAFRDKDREFVRILLREHCVNATTLAARIRELPIADEAQQRLLTWLGLTSSEL